MKKMLCMMLALCLVLALAVPAMAANTVNATITYRGVKIVVDGYNVVPCDANGNPVEPFIYNGTTYLPVRAVANALGLKVDWVDATSTVKLSSGGTANLGSGTILSTKADKQVALTYRDIKLEIDGRLVTPTDARGNSVEPFIYNGTTYLPVRAVSNALGLDVYWEDATSTVSLYDPESWSWFATEKEEYVSDDYSYTYTYEYDNRGNTVKEEYVSDYYSYTYAYEYDNRSDLVKEIYSDHNGNTEEYVYKHTYDANDRLIKDECISDNSSYAYEYTYTANGLISTERWTSGEESSTYTYTYDANGNLTQVSGVYSDGRTSTTSYGYDANGQCILFTYISGEECCTQVFSYDEDGRCVMASYSDNTGYAYSNSLYYNDDGALSTDITDYLDGTMSILTYTYDADGRCISYTDEFLSDNYSSSHVSTTTYSYNAAGDRIREVETRDSNVITTTCSFDNNHNCLKRTVQYADGSVATTTYTYKYIKVSA